MSTDFSDEEMKQLKTLCNELYFAQKFSNGYQVFAWCLVLCIIIMMPITQAYAVTTCLFSGVVIGLLAGHQTQFGSRMSEIEATIRSIRGNNLFEGPYRRHCTEPIFINNEQVIDDYKARSFAAFLVSVFISVIIATPVYGVLWVLSKVTSF